MAPQPISPLTRIEPVREVIEVKTTATKRAATIAAMTISGRDKDERKLLETAVNAFFADKQYAEALDAYTRKPH